MRRAITTLFVGVVVLVTIPASSAGPQSAGGSSTRDRVAPTIPSGILVATPRRGERIVLRSRPSGRALAVLGRKTEFGSPVKLDVVIARGNWLAVISERLGNGEIGWVPRARVSVWRVRWSIDVSLSRHVLEVRRDGIVVRRMLVAIGAKSSPTPTGRFAITDHLDATKWGGVYGCCILVLSGHQTHPPTWFDPKTDWRLAIHGGAGIGSAVSAGCLHARDSDLRMLMRLTPLGTPVVVTA